MVNNLKAPRSYKNKSTGERITIQLDSTLYSGCAISNRNQLSLCRHLWQQKNKPITKYLLQVYLQELHNRMLIPS